MNVLPETGIVLVNGTSSRSGTSTFRASSLTVSLAFPSLTGKIGVSEKVKLQLVFIIDSFVKDSLVR